MMITYISHYSGNRTCMRAFAGKLWDLSGAGQIFQLPGKIFASSANWCCSMMHDVGWLTGIWLYSSLLILRRDVSVTACLLCSQERGEKIMKLTVRILHFSQSNSYMLDDTLHDSISMDTTKYGRFCPPASVSCSLLLQELEQLKVAQLS